VTHGIIGGTLLLAIFYIVIVLIKSIPGAERLGVIVIITGWIMLTWLVLSLCMLIHAVFWRTLLTQKYNAIISSLIPLPLIVILISGFMALTFQVRRGLAEQNDPVSRAKIILPNLKFADLPESAKNVHVYAYTVLFIARAYVSFEAEPNDIEKFLADSNALEGITCHTYSKYRMRLATEENIWEIKKNIPFDKHEYFHPISYCPEWYKEEIRGAGRYYEFSEHESSWFGELIIDDENHIVYMHWGN
jgi:hypothetical protein